MYIERKKYPFGDCFVVVEPDDRGMSGKGLESYEIVKLAKNNNAWKNNGDPWKDKFFVQFPDQKPAALTLEEIIDLARKLNQTQEKPLLK